MHLGMLYRVQNAFQFYSLTILASLLFSSLRMGSVTLRQLASFENILDGFIHLHLMNGIVELIEYFNK